MTDRENELAVAIENAYEGWFEAKHEGYKDIAAQYKREIKRLEKKLKTLQTS